LKASSPVQQKDNLGTIPWVNCAVELVIGIECTFTVCKPG